MKNEYNNLKEEDEIEMPRLKITDVNFDSLPEINEKIIEVDYLERTSIGFFKTMIQNLKNFKPKEWIFIAFFCSILTLVLFCIDLVIAYGIDWRLRICSGPDQMINFIIWIFTAIVFLLLATSVGRYIAPEADGSGIPEVKTVLSGVNIPRCFSVE
jgi:H+/Cl- antiporter ClcA